MAARKRKRSADGLHEVYVGDFEGFVARRNALAKRLRAGGDDVAAAKVKRLKKPSRTAWAVNQFAAHGKKLRAELLKAGAGLRAAQEGLVTGDADREALIKARDRERAAVGGATEAIGALASEAGAQLNAAAAERVRQTLHAVALDDDVRAQFESARLTTDHEASGLGGGSDASARDGSRTAKRRRREELRTAEADVAKRDRELESAELELREATAAAKRAQGDLERATKRRDRAKQVAEAARAKVAALVRLDLEPHPAWVRARPSGWSARPGSAPPVQLGRPCAAWGRPPPRPRPAGGPVTAPRP